MADASYDSEVKNILNFLSLQKPAAEPAFEPSNLDVDVEDYLPHKYTRKYKGKVSPVHILVSSFRLFRHGILWILDGTLKE